MHVNKNMYMASHILRKIIYETGASRFYDTMKGPQDNIQVFRQIPQRYTDSQSRIRINQDSLVIFLTC